MPKGSANRSKAAEVQAKQKNDGEESTLENSITDSGVDNGNFNAIINVLNNDLKEMMQNLAVNVNNNMSDVCKSISMLVDSLQGSNRAQNLDQQKTLKEGQVAGADLTVNVSNKSNLNYISAWKDLGGNSVQFSAGGAVHPVAFVRKLKRLFEDANVPEEKKVNLAVGCLRGSALDWATIKESSFSSFQRFETMFMNRYWNMEDERAVYNKIRYGVFERGLMADYFLKLMREASYLKDPIQENVLIEMLVNHFPAEIKRGLLVGGYNKSDNVEEYLRRIDRSNEKENEVNWRQAQQGGRSNRPPVVPRQGGVNNREMGRNDETGAARQGGSSNRDIVAERESGSVRQGGQNTSRANIATIFYESSEDLLEETDTSEIKMPIMPVIDVQVGDVRTLALIDSGSQVSCVSAKFLEKIANEKRDLPRLPVTCTTVVGAFGNSTRVKEQVFITFRIKEWEVDYACIVIPGLVRDIVFGCDFIWDHHVEIKLKKSCLRCQISGEVRYIEFMPELNDSAKVEVTEIICESEVEKIERTHTLYSDIELKLVADSSETFDKDYREKLYWLLKDYQKVFSDQPGRTNLYYHEIRLKDESPFFLKSYPIAYAYRAEVRRQIKEMLEWGVIRQQFTEYVSPLVVVRKKGGVRVCLDARFLNKRMELNHVMPPNPAEFLFKFTEGQCLSSLDLTASYWQIPIREEHQKYTGFSYEGKTYVFTVLPFGLATSVGSFIVGLAKILGDVEDFVLPYVDDLLIFSAKPDLHLRHLAGVFERFESAGITVKLKKSKFAQKQISFVGHLITPQGVQMEPQRVEAIQKFPAPRNVKQLRGFLGLVNYDRRFCQGFSELTVPLLRLLRKNVSWKWGESEREAFERIKEAFLEVTMLKHPDLSRRFYVQTDASMYGISGCLYQLNEDRMREVTAYTSRTLRGAEVGYTVSEKEALAIVEALRQWRVFILGREVTVMTDHKSLSFLMSCRLLSPRLTRWTMYLQEYNVQIEYCKGSDNVVADILSRYPVKNNDRAPIEIPEPNKIYIGTVKTSDVYKTVAKKFKNITEWQGSDKFCQKVRAELEKEIVAPRYGDWYYVHDEVLFKRGSAENLGFKLVIPRVMITEVVVQEHNDNGHFGANKCFLKLKQYYFWPKMRQSIRVILASCDLCQKSKISERLHGEMAHVLPDAPNQILCLDLMGPLPVSRAGVTQLLVTIDAFSKYVCLFALRRATSRAIINCLEKKYFPRVGKPLVILSDNGTQFTSRLWSSALLAQGIEVRHTSVYYPQGNMTERVNREIGRLLRAFCHENHGKWAMLLTEIQAWLNRAIHDSTGFSPQELHFSKPLSNNLLTCVNFPAQSGEDNRNYVFLAYQRLRSKAERRKRRHDNEKRCKSFKIGDQVLVRTHPMSSAEHGEIKKFFLLFRGPGFIKTLVGNNAYEVEDAATGSSLGVQNIWNLKPYVRPEQNAPLGGAGTL